MSTSTYLNTEGVDGLLVGGASLKQNEFAAITASAHGIGGGA
jgi:triosephosphate isomerase